MRLTLVFPSVGRKENTPYVRAWQMQPLSMALLASLTPPEVDVRFYDDRMEEIPFDEPTDLVAMSVETFTALRAYKIARQFRARGVPVVMGGYHVTLLPEEAASRGRRHRRRRRRAGLGRNCSTTPGTVGCKPVYDGRGRRILSGVRPRREIFAGKRYQNITLVEFARGCNFQVRLLLDHRLSRREPEPSAGARSRRRNGGDRQPPFFIVDDNIVSQPAQVRELCRELDPARRLLGRPGEHPHRPGRGAARPDAQERLPRRADRHGIARPGQPPRHGQDWNLAGGGYAESLRRFREHGLAVYGTFVFGYDNDDAAIVQRSVDFAREQKLFLAAFNHLVPFPGHAAVSPTASRGPALAAALVARSAGAVGDVMFRPKRLSPEQLKQCCLDARRQFYSWGSILRRLADGRANAQSLLMLGVFLGLNATAHFDIDRRQGLRLGAGLSDWEAVHEPVPV